jgi:hypothetical protein
VFFSCQRTPTASRFFSLVKAVLLLSLDKSPVMPVSIQRHKTATATMLFTCHDTSTATVVLTTDSHNLTVVLTTDSHNFTVVLTTDPHNFTVLTTDSHNITVVHTSQNSSIAYAYSHAKNSQVCLTDNFMRRKL